MDKAKKFFFDTRFMWIGGVLGILQQFLGRLDYYLYHGNDIFSFSAIMAGLDFWAAFILLIIIRRNPPPKQHFRDVFLLFFGLDLLYYVYIYILDIVHFVNGYFIRGITSNGVLHYFQVSFGETFDLVKWTLIGTAAAVWSLISVKLRNKGKKLPYGLMLSPLFAVIFLQFGDVIVSMIRYFIQQYKLAHDIPLPYGYRICPQYSSLLLSCFLVGMLIHDVLKKRKSGA